MMKRNEPKQQRIESGGWRWMPMAATAALALLTATPATHAGYDLQGLGFLTGGSDSTARGISAGGTTVVGNSSSSSGTAEAFTWNSTTKTMVGLGDLSGGPFGSIAYDVNSDGTIIVGRGSIIAGIHHAFEYTGSSMTDLGSLGGFFKVSRAYGIDGAGTTIVGESALASGGNVHAFSYTGTGPMVDLGTMSGVGNSDAQAISKDGTTIVGSSDAVVSGTPNKTRAYRKVGSGSLQDLGTLPGGDLNSFAYDVDSNGSTVVGAATSSGSGGLALEAFLWNDTGAVNGDGSIGTMTGLGDLAGGDFNSIAYGVSSDGQVVVGQGRTGLSTGTDPDEAFVYFATTGTMELLSSVLSANSVSLTGWSQLVTAYAVSDVFPDGKTYAISGVGLTSGGSPTQQAFYATVELPPSLIPEPQVFGLVAGGMLLGMAAWRRRLRRSVG